MAFINNRKFGEIREAAKNGNEKAQAILQLILKGGAQGDLDNLVNDYYAIPPMPSVEQQEQVAEIEPEIGQEPIDIADEPVAEKIEQSQVQPINLTSDLDGEMEGLLDENEIEEISFGDFLKNKKRDSNRARKNSDYFKIFDLDGRNAYMQGKIEKYGKKFDPNRRNIERQWRDLDNSISNYTNDVNLMLDDDNELNSDIINQCYDELTDNESAMSSFGRHWDDQDNENMKQILQELVLKYGKKNVMAVLTTLRNDNDGYSKYKNNQIDTEINRYNKGIENLLK